MGEAWGKEVKGEIKLSFSITEIGLIMEFIDIERLMELAEEFQKKWAEYEEKLIQFEVWRDNYEDDEYYEAQLGHYESEMQENTDELLDSYSKISKKLCAQNVSLVPTKEKEVFKKIIGIISDIYF